MGRRQREVKARERTRVKTGVYVKAHAVSGITAFRKKMQNQGITHV
jgi:hypothetical protein